MGLLGWAYIRGGLLIDWSYIRNSFFFIFQNLYVIFNFSDKCIPENGTCSQDKINCCEGTACIVPYFTCMKCLYNGDYCDGDNSLKSCCVGDCKPKGNTTRSTCQK